MSLTLKAKIAAHLACITALALAGCAGTPATAPAQGADAALDDAGFADTVASTATDALPDVLKTSDSGGAIDFFTASDVVNAGTFGAPCQANAECDSAYCIPGPAGKICTKLCVDSCPDGFQCAGTGATGDVTFICIPRWQHLCDPCTENAGCVDPLLGAGAQCLDYGADGAFCGTSCVKESDCPTGYACSGEPGPGGKLVGQCRRTSGLCSCSVSAVAAKLSTTCGHASPFGVCKGIRGCGDQGLSPCTAAIPKAESCNAIDDNCDGSTDENIAAAPCVSSNAFGVCAGQTTCAAGKTACSAKVPAKETCNGQDDDCDGETDEASCDDGNPCTEDACNLTVGGCVFAQVTKPCNDGDVCTTSDTCNKGMCTGEGVKCSDGDACTTDSCDSKAVKPGCQFTANPNGACNDSDPCTGNDVCLAGNGAKLTCAGIALAEGASCTDGNACTVAAACAGGKCKATSTACDDANPCTDDNCDAAAGGACKHFYNIAACDDGNACTLGDSCFAGKCVGLGKTPCDDNDGCTADACDAKVGGCVNTPKIGVGCSDGNLCTTGDKCATVDGKSACEGTPLPCDDGKACTSDACNPAFGCEHIFVVGPCDDGDKCTKNDTCQAGQCLAGEYSCGECINNADCKAKEDGDLCNGTLYCEKQGHTCVVDLATVITCPAPIGGAAACIVATCDGKSGKCAVAPANEGGNCDDSNACTAKDACKKGACAGNYGALVCDDANPCTQDSCEPASGCISKVLEGVSCNDGDACSQSDACAGGKCVGGVALGCDDGNPCTTDGCDANKGCIHNNNTLPCSDGNVCTTGDVCLNAVCTAKAALNCDDSNACTTDFCDAKAGCAHAAAVGIPCSDGDACTQGDVCADSVCKVGAPLACDDGNPCTTDGCDPAKGCIHNVNILPCSDGNVCTTGDVCVNSVCTPKAALDCDDSNICTSDFCDAKTGCGHASAAGIQCNDGNACTAADKCTNGQCQGGGQLPCSDGNICTDDGCDPKSGCTFSPNLIACNDGNACTDSDACQGGGCKAGKPLDCNDANTCTVDLCDPAKGCAYQKVVDATPCNDGDLCTVSDKCTGGICLPGTKLVCNDSQVCTTDTCDVKIGCVYTPLADGIACDDVNICTLVDKCAAGKCTGVGVKDLDKDGHIDSKCPNGDDCDDTCGVCFPGQKEVCDDVDNDCKAGIDDGCDDDNDDYCDSAMVIPLGVVPKTCSKGGGDCNDTNAAINPGAVEKLEIDVDQRPCAISINKDITGGQPLKPWVAMASGSDGSLWATWVWNAGPYTDRLVVAGKASGSTLWTLSAPEQKFAASVPAIAVDASGRPHVAYVVPGTHTLRHAVRDTDGWTVETVLDVKTTGDYVAIAVGPNDGKGGVVHIAWYDATDGDLRYANNSGGLWAVVSVDSVGDVGRYVSMAVDKLGAVHLAYLDYTKQDLKYATDSVKAGQFVAQMVDGTASAAGFYSAIALDAAGKVHIAYYELVGSDLLYATNLSGAWQTNVVDSAGTVGQHASLAVASDGTVHISYRNVDAGTVRYASGKLGAWSLKTFGALLDGASNTALALSGNEPSIFYATSNAGPYEERLRLDAGKVGVFTTSYLDSGVTSYVWGSEFVGQRGTQVSSGQVVGMGGRKDRPPFLVRWLAKGHEWRAYSQATNLRPWAIATDKTGAVHACGDRLGGDPNTAGGAAIYVTGTWDTGLTATVIDPASKSGNPCSIAVAPDGKVHLTYYDSGNTVMRYVAITAGKPGTIQIPDPSAGTGNVQSLAVGSDGVVWALYGGSNLRLASTNPDATWNVETLAVTSVKGVAFAIEPNGKKHVFYVPSAGAMANKPLYRSAVGNVWSADVQVGTLSSIGFGRIAGAVDADGAAHVAVVDAGQTYYLTNRFGGWSQEPLTMASPLDTLSGPYQGNPWGALGLALAADGRVFVGGSRIYTWPYSDNQASFTYQNLVDDNCDGK